MPMMKSLDAGLVNQLSHGLILEGNMPLPPCSGVDARVYFVEAWSVRVWGLWGPFARSGCRHEPQNPSHALC